DGGSYRLRTLGSATLPEGCTAGPARIEQPTRSAALARVEHQCEHGVAVTSWAVELGRSPRVRETIRTLPPSEGAAHLGVALAVRDIDGDGRDDLTAKLTLGQDEPVELGWLDRPGGFSLNREEPSATIRALAEEAEKKR